MGLARRGVRGKIETIVTSNRRSVAWKSGMA